MPAPRGRDERVTKITGIRCKQPRISTTPQSEAGRSVQDVFPDPKNIQNNVLMTVGLIRMQYSTTPALGCIKFNVPSQSSNFPLGWTYKIICPTPSKSVRGQLPRNDMYRSGTTQCFYFCFSKVKISGALRAKNPLS